VDDLELPRFFRASCGERTSVDHNSMVRGSNLFQADYTSGFRIFKVKKARRPREVALLDIHPDTDAPLPSGTLLVSDVERGLFVVL